MKSLVKNIVTLVSFLVGIVVLAMLITYALEGTLDPQIICGTILFILFILFMYLCL